MPSDNIKMVGLIDKYTTIDENIGRGNGSYLFHPTTITELSVDGDIISEVQYRILNDVIPSTILGQPQSKPYQHIIDLDNMQMGAVYDLSNGTCERLNYGLTSMLVIRSDLYYETIQKILNGEYGKTMQVSLINGNIAEYMYAVQDIVQHCTDDLTNVHIQRDDHNITKPNWGLLEYMKYIKYNINDELLMRRIDRMILVNELVIKCISEYHPNYYWFRNEYLNIPRITLHHHTHHNNELFEERGVPFPHVHHKIDKNILNHQAL